MSEHDLPLSGAPHCKPRIENIIVSEIVKIVSMDVYPCGERCSSPVGTNIVIISKANYRDNSDLCIKIIVRALLSLPTGLYTVLYHTEPLPCVMDFCVGDNGCDAPDDPNRPWAGGTRIPTAAIWAIGGRAPSPGEPLATRNPRGPPGLALACGPWSWRHAGPATDGSVRTLRAPPPPP